MAKSLKHSRLSIACLTALGIAAGTPALAQEQATPSNPQQPTELDNIVVTGSRFAPRVATESATPIDSITREELARGGAPDLQSQLKVLVPSFSTPRPMAAGAIDFLAPPTMRGLSTGQLLVLVNGKRRHTSDTLNSNNQIGRGDVAYDFNSIPSIALKQIEVLRDGAAAQYGSDAIAGVMNLQLDDSTDGVLQARYGQSGQGDGAHSELAVGKGWALPNDGFFRVTAQFQDHEETNRARPDTRQQYFGLNASGNPVAPSANYGSGTGLTPSNGTLDPREQTIDRNMWVFGEPKYHNASIFFNAAIPFGASSEAYAFGGYNHLDGTSFNFFRRAGQVETVRSIHPDGFVPLQDVEIRNRSLVAGLKGGDIHGITWDLSTGLGASRTDIGYSNTNNVSYGNNSPTSFDRGNTEFRQWTTNLDFTRSIPIGTGTPLNIAFGGEYRKEYYDLRAGEFAVYGIGDTPFILDGPSAGTLAPPGAQPGGGFTPDDATSADRHSTAVYVELEKEFADRFLVSAAARYEDYSDFGSTSTQKLAARWAISDSLALRGSVGTGFRAPNLAQSYFSATNIRFLNGEPVTARIVSVNDPIAPLIGASPLKPEDSRNASAGLVFSRAGLAASIDFYRIKITDRIAISSDFQSAELTNLLAENGFPGIQSVSYLTNAVDTTTRGLDLTVGYRQEFGNLGRLSATFAANFNETTFDRIAGTPEALSEIGISTVLFDLSQQVRFTDSMPKDKISLSLDWRNGPWSASLVNTRYGEVAQVALTNRTPAHTEALLQPGYSVELRPAAANPNNFDIIQRFKADIVTDLEFGYEFTSGFSLSIGASNLFDKYPEEQIATTVATVAAGTAGADNNGIFPYAYIAPYGTTGRFLYVRLRYQF